MLLNGSSNVVGVSSYEWVERCVLGCYRDFDLADDVADRPTDVGLCASFGTPTACCPVACSETCRWETAVAVPTFVELSTIGAYVRRRMTPAVYTWFYNRKQKHRYKSQVIKMKRSTFSYRGRLTWWLDLLVWLLAVIEALTFLYISSIVSKFCNSSVIMTS